MAAKAVIHGRLCLTWNGGRDDEDQLGLTLSNGEVRILAEMVHDAVGAEWTTARLSCWLTDDPRPETATVPQGATALAGVMHAYYREHRSSAHGYQATEDYEPERYLYTAEVLTVGPTDVVAILKRHLGDYFHLVIEEAW